MKITLACCILVVLQSLAQAHPPVTYGSINDIFQREIEELRELERSAQKEKRVEQVLDLILSPIESKFRTRSTEEGDECAEGLIATCNGDIQCNAEGTESCRPVCDASKHGDSLFMCDCKDGFHGQLCDTTQATLEEHRRQCPKGAHFHTSNIYVHGYVCYSHGYDKTLDMKKGLSSSESDENEEDHDENLALIARFVHAAVDNYHGVEI